MTKYVDESLLIEAGPLKDYDGTTLLTDANTSSVTVSILKKDKTGWLVENAPMTYDETSTKWTYDWDTSTPTDLPYGTYKYVVIVTDPRGRQSIEEFSVRIARRRVVPVS